MPQLSQELLEELMVVGHLSAFTGDIWYVKVAAEGGSDTAPGTSPDTAFATIAHAISAASAGDAITIKAGTYDEDNLDMNLAGLELWGEVGAILENTTGGATETLTVSGNYCKITDLLIIQAGIPGIVISGAGSQFYNTTVVGATIGFDVNGSAVFLQSQSTAHTVTGFDIAAAGCLLYQCNARGTGAATYGFYLSAGAADDCFLHECASSGNATAGYEIVTGVARTIIMNCTSGAGDGRWVDTDTVNTWPGFTYDSELYHTTTFAGGGGGSDNLYLITGSVQVHRIFGEVTTVLNANVDNCKLELFDGGGTDITAIVDLSSAPQDSFVGKTGAIGAALGYESSAAAALIDWIAELSAGFTVVAKRGTNTYIRLNYSGVATDGVIHWHCRWSPLTEDGFVTAV